MSTPKPSPGNWFVEKYNEASWVVSTDGLPERDEEGHFANVVFDGVGNEADARIGAAAKELLEALAAHLAWYEGRLMSCDEEDALIEKTRAAIARVWGES